MGYRISREAVGSKDDLKRKDLLVYVDYGA